MRSSSFVAALSLLGAITVGACGRGPAPNPTGPSVPAVVPTPTAPAPPPVVARPDPRQPSASRVRVTVRATGYDPASINAPASQPLTLVFNRVDDQGCGGEVVFPDHGIRRTLPAGQDVEVTLTPRAAEQIHFTCAMAMMHGTIVAAR